MTTVSERKNHFQEFQGVSAYGQAKVQGGYTSFMDLLTGRYGFKEIQLQHCKPPELPHMAIDDLPEEEDTVSKAIEVSLKQGSGGINETIENLKVVESKRQAQESILSNIIEESAWNEENNWREDLFMNMQVDKIDQVANGNEDQSKQGADTDGAELNQDEENGSQPITEEELEEFLQGERKAASEGNNADIDSRYTPQIGQQFKTREDAHRFFTFYAYLAGFEVVITHTVRTISKKKNGEIYKVEMKCHRYKKEQKKTQIDELEIQVEHQIEGGKDEQRDTNVQIGTNCPVVMSIKEEHGFWKIIRLDLDHNHELSPENRNTLCCGRKYMSDMEKAMIRMLNDNNIATRYIIAILSYLRGGALALPY
ncbi:unnamed protein product [Urochloa humidicola]